MILAIGNPVFDELILPATRTNGRVLSGCSTNAALALARLGHRTIVCGTVGQDMMARAIEDLRTRGVETRLSPSAATGGFRLFYPPDGGERTLELLGRADTVPLPENGLLGEASAVIVGPILAEVAPGDLAGMRASFKGLFLLDPQGMLRALDGYRVIGRIQDGLREALPLFDVVKPNEHEAGLLTGTDASVHPERAAERLYSMGVRIAVVTLAERGSVVFDGNRMAHVPAYKVNAVDPTGAGDTYAAGFIHHYLRTADPFEAGLFGSAVASVMVEHVGPDFPLTPECAQARFEYLRDVVSSGPEPA